MKWGIIIQNQPFVSKSTTAYFPRLLSRNVSPSKHQVLVNTPKKVICQEFFILSDGYKRFFTEKDGITEYGQQKIISPLHISYMNLFINGVLQPKLNYKVNTGSLHLLTEDVPLEGTPIILQMITIY